MGDMASDWTSRSPSEGLAPPSPAPCALPAHGPRLRTGGSCCERGSKKQKQPARTERWRWGQKRKEPAPKQEASLLDEAWERSLLDEAWERSLLARGQRVRPSTSDT